MKMAESDVIPCSVLRQGTVGRIFCGKGCPLRILSVDFLEFSDELVQHLNSLVTTGMDIEAIIANPQHQYLQSVLDALVCEIDERADGCNSMFH